MVAIASTSAVLDQIVYDPFGNIVTQTNHWSCVHSGASPGWNTTLWTGLYYDHARYYDTAIGRFTTSQDPSGFAAGDANLYRYVNNEPTVTRDTSGYVAPILAGAGLGALYGLYPRLRPKRFIGGMATVSMASAVITSTASMHSWVRLSGLGGGHCDHNQVQLQSSWDRRSLGAAQRWAVTRLRARSILREARPPDPALSLHRRR